MEDGGESLFGYSRRDFDGVSDRRAALFTRDGDRSPQVARSGQLTVVFDGELYDPWKLAEGAGVAKSAESAAMLLLRCYESRGQSFFPKLRGMFVLVVWDAGRDELFCVRDPLGYYPCFFAEPGRKLLISTSARVLLNHPAVSKAVNLLELLDYYFDIWARREETFYESVKRVSPGHALRAAKGNTAIYRYWNPLPVSADAHFLHADELWQFPQMLARSVDRCLEHGPAGIFLSGGLDSVSVAAIARRSSRTAGTPPPFALSLVFPYPEYSEEKVQRRVASELGLPQALVRLDEASGPTGLFGAIPSLARNFAFPIQNYWMPAYNHLVLLSKQRGVRAILTGGGGDEWLGVTPLLSADLIRSLRFVELYNIWASVSRTIRVSKPSYAWNLIWLFGLRQLLRQYGIKTLGSVAPGMLRSATSVRRARRRPAWLKVEPRLWASFLKRLESSETDFEPLEGPYGYYFGDGLRGLNHPIVSWEMEEHFENARNLGVRFLHPYIDADLVNMVCAVPPKLLMLGHASKGLVREFLSREFRGLGFESQKKIGIRRTLPQGVLGDIPGLWRENGKAKALSAAGLVDAEQLDTYFGCVLKSERHHDTFRAWQIMATEHWLRAQQ